MIGRIWFGVEKLLEAVMALFLLAMAIITAIDVVGRYFLSAPLHGGYEMVQYLMALSVFAALPLATRADAHLTIDLFTGRLRGRPRKVHRVIVLILSTIVLAFLAWRMGIQAGHLQKGRALSGSLGMPLAPIAWIMTVLAWLAVAASVSLIVQAVTGREVAPSHHGEEIG
ncbi:TRAP transporter small permease [Paracoccus sp. (in: a-proteobacteria)]|uniref:TRAP transporter small permease n=1 Tax=Paracoccus sp. TaxID=267 RepID=UPI003A888154